MLNIIICDDDHFTLQLVSELLKRAIDESSVAAKIVCLAATGQELLYFIHNAPGNYLYFLDFDLGNEELNGIDMVRRIYQLDPDGKIVFVTSHIDKGMDILRSGVRAFGFIEKTVNQKRMIQEFVRYLQMASPTKSSIVSNTYIELPIGIDEMIQLPISDISYVDSVKTVAHTICYHTFDGSTITVRDTIEHAQCQLGEDFIRCHRSVVVNRKYVISMSNGMLKLSNGVLVSCALGKRKFILEKCFGRKEKFNG